MRAAALESDLTQSSYCLRSKSVGRSSAGLSLLLQGGVDRVQQVGFLKRFDQVSERSGLECPGPRILVAKSGDEDCRDRWPSASRRLCSSKPFNPGICTSKTRQAVAGSWPEARKSSAEANVSTANPYDLIRRRAALRTELSSSTIITINLSFVMFQLPRLPAGLS